MINIYLNVEKTQKVHQIHKTQYYQKQNYQHNTNTKPQFSGQFRQNSGQVKQNYNNNQLRYQNNYNNSRQYRSAQHRVEPMDVDALNKSDVNQIENHEFSIN